MSFRRKANRKKFVKKPKDVYIVQDYGNDRLLVCINNCTFANMPRTAYEHLKEMMKKEEIK